MSEAVVQASLAFCDAAASKVKTLIEQEGNEQLKLRVFVTGGGCSGFQYRFELDKGAAPGDMLIERDGATVAIDPISAGFVTGSELDFVDELIGAQFTIHNPNATASCGCGTSFSI